MKNEFVFYKTTGGRVFISTLFSAFGFTSCTVSTESKPANIVFILVDDIGWKDLRCTGSTYHQTPNIDQLASEGILFNRAYSTSPVSSPSRGAIFSGKSPARTGFTSVYQSNSVEDKEVWHTSSKSEVSGANSQYLEAINLHVLPLSEYTFAEALRDAGYKTGYLGKWHCGWHKNFSPENQGFDYAEGYRTVPSYTRGHFGKHYIGKVKGLDNLKPEEDMADVLTERAVRFIERNKETPFLLVLSHFAVHAPIMAKKEVIDKYKTIPVTDHNNPAYAAMVESVDKSVGAINAKLKELGIDENTLIVFTSDNGGYVPVTSNYPLLGGKSMAYEASMRVPMIIKWPDVVKNKKQSDIPVVSTDLYPTFLEAAQVSFIPEQHKDGVSLCPILREKEFPKRNLHFHFPHYTGYTSPYSVIVDLDDWKLIRFYNDGKGGFQLFNMKEDPYEQVDLSAKNPRKLNELLDKMEEWQKQTGAKMPRPNPKYDSNKPITYTGEYCYKAALRLRKETEDRLNSKKQEN